MTRYAFDYETLDFRPAPVGWTVYYFDEDAPRGILACPLAGWEIQAERKYDADTCGDVPQDAPLSERPRRVVPVDMDSCGYVEAVTCSGNFWMVTGPGQPAPTDEQIAEAWAKYRAKEAAKR